MARLDFLDCLANELIRLEVIATGHVFVNKQLSTPDDCLAFFGLPGTNIQDQRDVPGLQFPRFQLVARDADYNDASDLAQAARDVLHGMVGVILPHGVNTDEDPYIRVMRCHADIEGGPLGEDDQGRSEFSTNYIAEWHYYDPAA